MLRKTALRSPHTTCYTVSLKVFTKSNAAIIITFEEITYVLFLSFIYIMQVKICNLGNLQLIEM